MIISHSNKFIYVKSYKTASTSVEIFFERLCSDSDIVGYRGPNPIPNNCDWWNHMSPLQIKTKLDNDNVWDTDPKPYLRGIFDGIQKDIPNLHDNQGLKYWISNYPDCYCGNNYISGDILKKYLGNVDEKGNYFRWEFTYSQEELTQLISKKTGISFESISSLQPLYRGISGRITQLQIKGISKR